MSWFLQLINRHAPALTDQEQQLLDQLHQLLSSQYQYKTLHIQAIYKTLKRLHPKLPSNTQWGAQPEMTDEAWWQAAAQCSAAMAFVLARLLGLKEDEWDPKYTQTRYGREALIQLGVHGFAHPSAIRALGDQLNTLGIDTLLDPAAGSGFFAMMFTAICGLKVHAFDKKAPLVVTYPRTALLYPVVCHTDYRSLNFDRYDWKCTALCLSWLDRQGAPPISTGVLTMALKAGVQYLLVCNDQMQGLAFSPLFETICQQFFNPISECFYADAGTAPHIRRCCLQLFRVN